MAHSGFKNDEKPAERWALVVTILLHGLVLGGLFSLVAWREPDPPLPQVGIELNFGLSDEGSGETQPEPSQTESIPEQPLSEPENTPPSEQDIQEQPVKSETVTQPKESPVAVQPVQKKLDPVKTEPVPPKEKPQEKKPDVKTLYDPQLATNTKKTGADQGDSPNAAGDKGKPEGKVDEAAVYSGQSGAKSGIGGGTGLDLAGWKWDREPRPKLSEQEQSGSVVFDIEVDSEGVITGLTTVSRGISPAAEKLCRDEIFRLKFIQVGAAVPEYSKGRITIVVRAQ